MKNLKAVKMVFFNKNMRVSWTKRKTKVKMLASVGETRSLIKIFQDK